MEAFSFNPLMPGGKKSMCDFFVTTSIKGLTKLQAASLKFY